MTEPAYGEVTVADMLPLARRGWRRHSGSGPAKGGRVVCCGDQHVCGEHSAGSFRDDSSGFVRGAAPQGVAATGTVVELSLERQAAAAAVVAEAVALAMEAAAAEAAEAVLVSAAAVTEAAIRAANAAESARRARAVAAGAAAQSVAHAALRAAARVQLRADLAAAQVRQAASIAADGLTHRNTSGVAHGTERSAELLAATVSAAAEATAQDTARAACAVAEAAAAAAVDVTLIVAAAEAATEGAVTAEAEAQRDRAAAIAAAVALETEARAIAVANAARQAAEALVADWLDTRALGLPRDAAESGATRTPGAAARVGVEATDDILAAADKRDSEADIRDRLADERERDVSLRSFVADQPYEESGQFLAGLKVRRAAAGDRSDSRTDRLLAASDRAGLNDHLTASRACTDTLNWHMSGVAAELSHDLLVPLSSVVGSVEMLEDQLRGHSDKTVAALLGHAMRAGNRMVRMLDQSMTMHTPLKPTSKSLVDLAEVLHQLVLDSAHLLEPVSAIVETGELPIVQANRDQMYSVLQNLLNNSIKYARPGVPAVVRISARRSVQGWRISVRDNGIGLPQANGLNVFSMYSCGTSSVDGHGIGLATVARIVATHGGRVGAASSRSGAEIWFELPEDQAVG